jgi:molybdopterin converting factor small subunit
VPFLPWYPSHITELTLGFPTYTLSYFCTFLSVFESFVLTIINAAFAINQKGLFEKSAMQQFEFCFSLSFTFLNGIVTLIECLLMQSVKAEEGAIVTDDNRRGISPADDKEMELVEMSVNNPIQKDLEAAMMISSTKLPSSVIEEYQLKQTNKVINTLVDTIEALQADKSQLNNRVKETEERMETLHELVNSLMSRINQLEENNRK